MKTKESPREWEQLNVRRLSSHDFGELRIALRTARESLCGGEIDPEARHHLDGVGIDYSNLVRDGHGDAPDRFDRRKSLDWRWRPVPAATRGARRYHQVRNHPRVGDRVRRLWSNVLGTVTNHEMRGRGFLVDVEWDGAPFTSVAMSHLIPVILGDGPKTEGPRRDPDDPQRQPPVPSVHLSDPPHETLCRVRHREDNPSLVTTDMHEVTCSRCQDHHAQPVVL